MNLSPNLAPAAPPPVGPGPAPRPPQPRRSLSWPRVILAASLLTLLVSTGFWAFWPGAARNVLVLGVDRGGERSDTLILVTASAAGLRFLSIPRDTRTVIPGRAGQDKIGHAHAYGGPELAAQAVSGLTGRPVHGYIEFDFAGFAAVVDALGGVEIEVERRMLYHDPYQNLRIDLKPGRQTLNGEQALQYVRFRHDELGDIGRIRRQQKFIAALLDQALHPTRIWRLPGAMVAGGRHVRTNLGGSLPALVAGALRSRASGLHATSVPGRPVNLDGISYWAPDVAALQRILAGETTGGAGQGKP